MDSDKRDCRLDISDALFRLTTESVRLHSNATGRHQSLGALIDARMARSPRLYDHDTAVLASHLATVETEGSIPLTLSLSGAGAEGLEELRQSLCEQLESGLTLGDTVSVVLFDYVVEHKTAGLFERLTLETSPHSRAASLKHGTSH